MFVVGVWLVIGGIVNDSDPWGWVVSGLGGGMSGFGAAMVGVHFRKIRRGDY